MDANNAEGDSIGKMWRLWIPVIESEDVKKYKDGFKNKHTNNPVHCTLYTTLYTYTATYSKSEFKCKDR